MQPRVSPDGRRLAFASNRGNDEGDVDIWLMRLFDKNTPDETGGRGPAFRFARIAGYEGHPAWSPDGTRLAYYAVRDGPGSTWVAGVAAVTESGAAPSRPLAPPVLASRHGGITSWSPDGQILAIGEIPEPEPSYNGNPQRDRSDRTPGGLCCESSRGLRCVGRHWCVFIDGAAAVAVHGRAGHVHDSTCTR